MNNKRTSFHTEQTTKLESQQYQQNQQLYRTSQDDSLQMNYYAFAPASKQSQQISNDSTLTQPINATISTNGVIQKQPIYGQQLQQQQQFIQQQLSSHSSAQPVPGGPIANQQVTYNRVIDNNHSLNTKIPTQGQVLLSQPQNEHAGSFIQQPQGVQQTGLEQSTRTPVVAGQKVHTNNRRIFDDSSERAMRGSSASFNRGQQQQSRIFKQSPISQRKANLKEKLPEERGDDRQTDIDVNQQIYRNQSTNNNAQQQQQFVQVPPQFPVSSQSAGPGIRLLKNSVDIVAPRLPDQLQQYSANNLPSSSDLASFGVIKLKEQMTNALQANGFDKTTPTPQNIEQQQQLQIQQQQQHQISTNPSVMRLSNLTTQQSQICQQPLKNSLLQNPSTQPLLQGLSGYNRVTDQQAYPQQQQQFQQQLTDFKTDTINNKVEITSQQPVISKDNRTISFEKDYQKLLNDNNTLTEQLLDAQVQIQQLNETISQMNEKNQTNKQQTEEDKMKQAQQQTQEVTSLRNQLAEKDRQFNEVIQELRDAQKQLGLFADQVLTLKSQLGQVQQSKQQGGEVQHQQQQQGEEVIKQTKEQQQQLQQQQQPKYIQNIAIQQPQQQQKQSIGITNRLPQHLTVQQQSNLPKNYQVVLSQKDQNLPTTYITPNINPKNIKTNIPQLQPQQQQQQQQQQQPTSWLFPSTNTSKQLDPRKPILQVPSSSSSRTGTPDRFGSNPPDISRMMAMNQNRMLFTNQPIKFNP